MPDVAPGRSKGRLLVFTTWKCLGDGDWRDMYWKTHQKSEPPNRSYGFGHAMWTFEWSDDNCPSMHKVNAKEIQHCVASVRESQRVEGPHPQYTDVVGESGSRVVDMEKSE